MATAKQEATGNRPSWRLIVLLALAFALNYADRQFFFSALPKLHIELALSDAELGLAGGVFAWSYAIAMPLAGYMADRIARLRLVIAALFLWSLSTLGTSLSLSLSQLLFWRVMMGITEALFLPAAFAMIPMIYPAEARSRAFSILGVAQFVGLALGGTWGGWSSQHLGWRHGAQTLAFVGVIYAVVLVVLFKKIDNAATPRRDSASPLRTLLSLRVAFLAITFFGFCAMLWMIYAWLPTVIHEKFHLDLAASGVNSTLYLQVGSALGVFAGGAAGDWAANKSFTSRLDVALAGILFCSPFALAIFATNSLTLLRVATLGFGLSSGFFIANTFACLYDFTDRTRDSFATGCLNLLGGAGAGIAVLLAGVFKNTWGIASLMLCTASFTLTAGLCLWLMARKTNDLLSRSTRAA
jgi:predicted MFS family arabinose efflux permease